MSELT